IAVQTVGGTWYELDLDFNNPSPTAPTPVNVSGLPNIFAFLIAPFQAVHFNPITFSNGQYLQFNASRTSFAATAVLAIDMIDRGIFGAELTNPSLLLGASGDVLAALVKELRKTGCASEAV